MNAVVEKILNKFPELENDFKDLDIDKQKSKLLDHFFCKYLIEFNVDIENIKRNQLSQYALEDGEMVPTINFKCTINTLIPEISLGLFDLLVPHTALVVSKVNHALRFYDFSDKLMSSIYESITPYIQAQKEIKLICLERNEILKVTKNIESLKTPHIMQCIEMTKEGCESLIKSTDGINDERRALEQQLQQKKSIYELALRKKLQAENTLKTIKEKINSRKLALNQSYNCDEQIDLLSTQLNTLRQQSQKALEKNEQSLKETAELVKLRDTFAERCATVMKINETLAKLNEMKKETNLNHQALLEINEEIAKEEQKKKELTKKHAMQCQMIQNEIERNRLCGDNQAKLERLKEKQKSLQSILKKYREHGNKMNEIHKLYLAEENKLIKLEKGIVQANWTLLNQYRSKAKIIAEKIKNYEKKN